MAEEIQRHELRTPTEHALMSRIEKLEFQLKQMQHEKGLDMSRPWEDTQADLNYKDASLPDKIEFLCGAGIAYRYDPGFGQPLIGAWGGTDRRHLTSKVYMPNPEAMHRTQVADLMEHLHRQFVQRLEKAITEGSDQ